jgi:gamma-glutamylcysteine synthetase
MPELEYQMKVQDCQIDRLYRYATQYHSRLLDAFGLGAVNEAVRAAGEANVPKAKAIQDWSSALWSDYRTRKEAVIAGTFEDNYDFSNHGELPCDFYEAMDEAETVTQ